jgi:asparagine synthase (glutamine-hydrolysing)
MCGLIGALLGEPSLTDERIAGALATISHRGPDHTGWWCSSDRRTVLGHVRLSIIGLDNGDQPLVSAGGEVRCVVNGELYGYRAIRNALKGEGRHFASDSDSEIALHLYEKLGGDFVHHLRGEFAVVIADQRRRCLIAVRDRFGIKPLFYTVQGGDVLVASEIKALLALGAPARWDAAAFFAECHYVRAADRTLFAGIRAVPPGCTLVARDGQVEVRPYWDTDYPSCESLAADGRSDADIVAGFREVLDNAVAERLVADVEVASYLSGGIDSSAVLGLASAGRTVQSGRSRSYSAKSYITRNGWLSRRPNGWVPRSCRCLSTSATWRRLSPTRSGTRRPWFSTLMVSPSSCCPVPCVTRGSRWSSPARVPTRYSVVTLPFAGIC